MKTLIAVLLITAGLAAQPVNPPIAGGTGTPGGATGTVQYNAGSGNFGGNSAMTFDPTTGSLTLTGAGVGLPPLAITQTVGANNTPGAIVTTATVNGLYTGGQYQVVTNNGTYTGAANPTSLVTNYNNVVNQSTGGDLQHFFAVVGRAYQQGTGTIDDQAGVYADGSVTGSGLVGKLMSFNDAGRTVGSGASVTDSYGVRVSGTSGAGTVVNDYGVLIPTLNKGSSRNVGLSIGGGPPSSFTGALYVVSGQSRFDDLVVQNGSSVSVASADASLFNQLNSIVGGNTSGTLIGFDSSALGNQGGGQTAAGFTGYRSNLYEGNAGTASNIINFQAQSGGNGGAGVVTNYYAFKVDDAGSSNFTNFYGLYIGSTQHGGNTNTNRYGIYSSDAGAILFNNGPIAIGPNCSSAASPAVCTTASAGSVVVAAAATSVVVNTTAVKAASQIFVTYDSSLGSKLGVTCNVTEPALFGVTARTAGTSFTITSSTPITNPACFSYLVVN